MDRAIIYPGQVPLETDLLKTNQFGMVGLAKLAQAMFGTAGAAVGFTTTQTVVPSLAVLVGPGEIYSSENLEATAFSSLPQDLAHTVLKQGIALDATTLAVTPPGTPGFSINFLVQVDYQDLDSGSTVLPYYNATNPGVAYSGPANSGASQPVTRRGAVVVNLKAGTAAATGTQTTPAPDAGKFGLYVVTVANGASSVVNANISAYPGSALLTAPLTSGRLLGVRTYATPGSFTYDPSPGTASVYVEVQGAGGAGGGAAATTTGATGCSAGGPGNAGALAIARLTSGFAGASIVVGAAGTVGAVAAPGNAGGTSSFGSVVANGGAGGDVSPGALAAPVGRNAQAPATASGGNVANIPGNVGAQSFVIDGGGIVACGASSRYGVGGSGAVVGASVGRAASGYGAGGCGSVNSNSLPAVAGAAGSGGIVLIWEYA